jgi:hypothetical protein
MQGLVSESRAQPMRVVAQRTPARLLSLAAALFALGSAAWIGARMVAAIAGRELVMQGPELSRALLRPALLPLLLFLSLRLAARARLLPAPDGWELRTLFSSASFASASQPVLAPFRVPLFAPGGRIRFAGGASLPWLLEWPNPPAPLPFTPPAETGREAYARARAVHRCRLRPLHHLARFLLFPAALALPFFYFQQWIEFGGTFGELVHTGAGAYAASYLRHFVTAWLQLFACGAAARLPLELSTLALTLWQPARAGRVRSGAEWLQRACVYLLFPALLYWRFALA